MESDRIFLFFFLSFLPSSFLSFFIHSFFGPISFAQCYAYEGFSRRLSGRGICLPMQEMWVQSLGQEDPLKKEMATHFSILACRIPCTEEPGRLQSMDHRVGHDWTIDLLMSVKFLHVIGYRSYCCRVFQSDSTIHPLPWWWTFGLLPLWNF